MLTIAESPLFDGASARNIGGLARAVSAVDALRMLSANAAPSKLWECEWCSSHARCVLNGNTA